MQTATRRPRRTQYELAWDLAATMAPRLARPDRNRLFARIGAGDTFGAMEELLTRAAHSGYPVSGPLADDIGQWVRGYNGTVREPRLRVIIAQLQIGDSSAVDVRSQIRCTEG